MHYLYIMASRKDGILYIGSTADLSRRVYQHKLGPVGGFTGRYVIRRLVYFECHPDARSARERERRMKEWKREWKIRLITAMNPDWQDISQRENFTEGPGIRRGGA